LFSPCTPVSSTNKTDRQEMTEKLLKVALSTINVPSEMKVKSGTNEKTQGVSRYGFKFKNMLHCGFCYKIIFSRTSTVAIEFH
jgi:hypothetical protein